MAGRKKVKAIVYAKWKIWTCMEWCRGCIKFNAKGCMRNGKIAYSAIYQGEAYSFDQVYHHLKAVSLYDNLEPS